MLPVRQQAGGGFHVDNLFIIDCYTEDDMRAVLEEGLRNRQTASHDLNERSSRSHTILTLYIEGQTKLEEADGKVINSPRCRLNPRWFQTQPCYMSACVLLVRGHLTCSVGAMAALVWWCTNSDTAANKLHLLLLMLARLSSHVLPLTQSVPFCREHQVYRLHAGAK